MDKIGAYGVPGMPAEYVRKYISHLIALKHNKARNVKEYIGKKIDIETDSIGVVVKIACEFFMIDPWIIKSKSRKRPGVVVRQMIQKYCDDKKLGSKNSIAKQTGEGNHANVYNSSKKVEEYLNLPIYYIFFNNNSPDSCLNVINKAYTRIDKVSEVYSDMEKYIDEELKKSKSKEIND